MAIASGAGARREAGTSSPWGPLTRTTCGLSVSRPKERIGFFSSSVSPRVAIGRPASRTSWTRLTSSSSLSCASRSGRGFLTLASSRSIRLVTTPRSAKSSSSRKAARSAAGSPPAKAPSTTSSASPSRIRASRWGLSPCVPGIRPGVSSISTVAGVTFLGRCSAARKSSRVSDSVATPTCPAWTLPGSGVAPVRSWNSVLLPPPANPTRPTLMADLPFAGDRVSPGSRGGRPRARRAGPPGA